MSLSQPSRRCSLVTVVLLSISSLGCSGVAYAQAQPSYTVSEIGSFGEVYDLDWGARPDFPGGPACKINNLGQVVVGAALPQSVSHYPRVAHFYLWSNTEVVDLGSPADHVMSLSLNDRRQVAISSTFYNNNFIAIWDQGRWTEVNPPSGYNFAFALHLTETGTVYAYGQAIFSGCIFSYNNGMQTIIATLPTENSSGLITAANEHGDFAGQRREPFFYKDNKYTAGHKLRRANWDAPFLYKDNHINILGRPQDIGEDRLVLEHRQLSYLPIAINDKDQVVGKNFFYDGQTLKSAMVSNKEVRFVPFALNNNGQVVGGMALYSNRQVSAFLWQKGKLVNLNTLIPANSGWRLEAASSINDHGQIVGVGTHNGQERRPFLLTPR